MKLKERIEEEWGKRKWNSTSDCRAPDTCSSQAKSAFCSDQFGRDVQPALIGRHYIN